MGPTIAVLVSAFAGGFLLVLAAVAVIVFPKVSAVRLWAGSWLLAAAGCLLVSLSPLVALYFWGTVELTLRTSLVLGSGLLLALGFLGWFRLSPDRGKGVWLRTFLWGGTVLALVPVALGLTERNLWAWTLVTAWAGVPVVLAAGLLSVLGLRDHKPSVRSQSLGLLRALSFGPVLYVLSWMVLPAFPALGWPLGFPPLLVLGAALTLWALVHHDTRFHHRHTSGFLVEKIPDTVVFLQADGRIQASNPALHGLLDYEESDLTGRTLSSLGADEEGRSLLGPLEMLTFPDWEGRLSVLHRSGRPVPVHLVFRRIHNPAREAVGAVILLHDLRLPRRIDLTLHEDALTALSNRRWVLELLEAEYQRVKRYGGPLSALWFSLDGLEEVERRFGWETCDDVLRRMGAILRGGLRKTDFCGRLEDQAFLAVLPETTADRAEQVGHRIEKMFLLSTEGESCGAALRFAAATLDDSADSGEAFVAQLRSSVTSG